MMLKYFPVIIIIIAIAAAGTLIKSTYLLDRMKQLSHVS